MPLHLHGLTPGLPRVCLLAALALLAGCQQDTTAPSEEVAQGSAPLTGSATQSLPAISLRNALLTQPFDPELLTPDGRLGLSFLGGSRVRFIALGDPAMNVSGGTPRFAAPMAQGQTLDVNLPPLAARSINFQRSDGAAPLYTSSGFDIWTNSGQGALSLDPRFSPAGKPFPVNEPDECLSATTATRERVVSPGGRYECYRLIHFQPYYAPTTGALALHQALVAVVVDARRPDTTTGTVARAAAPNVVRVQYLSSNFSLCRSQGQPFYLWALEASATADARLVVSEGGRWSYNETPWNPDTWTTQREFGALFDSVRLDVEGTRRICRQIDPASGQPSCTTATEEDFARVYPLAARPIFLADGSRRTDGQLPTHLQCGYTWITPEGTDVFCRPNPAINGSVQPSVALELTQGFESSTGMHFFAFGQHTGWTMRRLDSAINSRRFNPEGLNSFPPVQPDPIHRPFSPVFLNTATGFWAENRTSQDRALPLQRQWPLFQFMTLDDGIRNAAGSQYASLGLLPESGNPGMWTNMHYWEASFACGLNAHCLLHLPMNELFYDKAAAAGSPAILRALPLTQDVSNNTDFLDTSGNALTRINPYVGQLQGGTGAARFAGEVYGAQSDERYLSGYRGTAISLTAGGFVSVAGNAADLPTCRRNKGCLAGERYDNGFTAEVAFLPLFNPSAATLPIARHNGLWAIRIQGGTLVADVSYTVAGVARALTLTAPGALPFSSLSATPAAQAASWRHAALRVAPDESRVFLLVDGVAVAQAPLEAGAVFQGTLASGNEAIRVGPGGQCTGCPAGDVLFVDELVFHRAALPFEELAASASVFSGRQDFLTPTEARTLLARYFSVTNPRRLTLQPDGFPRFLRAEDLRIPAAFRSFVAAGQESAFRQLVSVGESLFRSPVLSTNAAGVSQAQAGTGEPMSCATCHRLDRTFTDGRATAVGVQPLALNTPTLVNRAFGTNQFFARRAQDLMDLALEPVVDPREMNADVNKILERINTGADQASLRQGFANVFQTSTVTREHLELALSAFQLVQLSVDSLAETVIASGKPVVDSEGNLLRPELLRLGKELFEGKARCGACHVGSNLTDELAHDTGVAASPQPIKTPTLWDVASTAPYFHDGSRATLRQVLDFYNQGGTAPGRVRDGLRMIDPELRPLALSEYELMALEQYLRALRNAEPVLATGFEGLAFSDHGPIPGMSCVSVNESADPAGWSDNYLCSPQSRGIVWSSGGPVAGMRCTAINEGFEPPETTWTDNYLCVPSDSPLRLSWSMGGPLFGKSCVRFHEPMDPHSWGDNYLCYDEPLRLRFSAEGLISGLTCTLMDEGYDHAGGWNDNQLCANKDIGLRWSMGGPLAGMRCTRVYEDAEPPSTTWGDNYACVPRESDVQLSYSQSGPIAGLSCAQVYEPRDPQPWVDNYLCYREEPLVLTFHGAGAPADKSCISVNESSDPGGTWGDNYFCANRDIGMRWSSAGPTPGMRCTQVNEPAEPLSTSWEDNYLCLPTDSRLTFEWSYSGPIAGRICTAWAESADPHSWMDNHLCYSNN